MKQVHLGREPDVSFSASSGLGQQWTRWTVQWLMSYWSQDLSDVLPFYSIPLPHLSIWSMISVYGVSRREASVLVATSYATVL